MMNNRSLTIRAKLALAFALLALWGCQKNAQEKLAEKTLNLIDNAEQAEKKLAEEIEETKTMMATLSQQCKAFKLNLGYFPNTLDDLINQPANMTAQKWRGPYLDTASIPGDAWENAFTYSADENTNKIQITSAGPDGQSGTADDLSNSR